MRRGVREESRAAVQVRVDPPYTVTIGHGAVAELAEAVGHGRRALILHPAVMADSAAHLETTLRSADVEVHVLEIPDAEDAKTAQVLAHCWGRLGQLAFDRSDVIVGLGGGATTDLAGFVAATWLRGVRLIQIPTTLLAMVDAAVGGKTGINTAEGKNLVGAFHSPAAVLCDLDALLTLPKGDLIAGMAEIIKCGFIADTQILTLVEQDPARALDPEAPVLAELVERAVRVKADVVAADLRESHLREILNYGHTLGHAIEHTEHYRWRHGDAVAVGMVYAAELAHAAGRLDAQHVRRHREVLTAVGLPTGYAPDRWAQLYQAMLRDKKTRSGVLRFVVLDDIGRPGRLEGPDPQHLVAAYGALSEPTPGQ